MTKQICLLLTMTQLQLTLSYEDCIYQHKQLINVVYITVIWYSNFTWWWFFCT